MINVFSGVMVLLIIIIVGLLVYHYHKKYRHLEISLVPKIGGLSLLMITLFFFIIGIILGNIEVIEQTIYGIIILSIIPGFMLICIGIFIDLNKIKLKKLNVQIMKKLH